jgi:hypothetical protein
MEPGTIHTKALHTHRVRPIVRYAIGLITGLAGVANMVSAIIPRLNWDVLLKPRHDLLHIYLS